MSEVFYGRCARCGGSLVSGHVCPKGISNVVSQERREKDCPRSILAAAIRLYAAANQYEGRELAKAWGCSASTVTRFLSGQQWPDGKTTARIIAWLLQDEAI